MVVADGPCINYPDNQRKRSHKQEHALGGAARDQERRGEERFRAIRTEMTIGGTMPDLHASPGLMAIMPFSPFAVHKETFNEWAALSSTIGPSNNPCPVLPGAIPVGAEAPVRIGRLPHGRPRSICTVAAAPSCSTDDRALPWTPLPEALPFLRFLRSADVGFAAANCK
ncbi:hypothetical protein J6590_004265 [Homalodisca vitripennis]|nr:hypothetical protein J6590_004265 [Homalodisca vitripennis]